jgi:hypothetical protein
MLSFRVFVALQSRTSFPHLRLRPLTSSISSRINTCKSVSKQTTLTLFRMNTYEKHRGVGVLLLTRFPLKESDLRSIARFVRPGWACGATKDLSTLPMSAYPACPEHLGERGPSQLPTESARSCVPSTSGCYTASGALSGPRFPIEPGTAASTAPAIAAPCGDTKAIRGTSHDPR